MLPILFFWSNWACQTTSSEPESKIVVVQETKHAAPAAGDFEKNSFQCCSDPDITEMLDSYLKLQEAMAGDDEKQSLIYGGLFHTILSAQSEKHDSLKPLTELTSAWGKDPLKEIRMDFEDFNRGFLPFIDGFKSDSGRLTVSKAFCPMAPGRWLQQHNELRNPYYGAEMLTCGVFEE